MDVTQKDKDKGTKDPAAWKVYQRLLNKAEGGDITMEKLER